MRLIGSELDGVRRNTPYGLHPMPLPNPHLNRLGTPNPKAELRDEIDALKAENAQLRNLIERNQLCIPLNTKSLSR